MADNARKTHVSPGIYSREIDLNYAVKSLGITTLGLAGETLKGPAFEPMHIENWAQFQDVFGGTSTEKFMGTQYPKYELPYIAKSYLTESKQLEVVRVLGLSGFNAGPAWAITAKRIVGTSHENMVVAVLRSRGYYNDYERYAANSGNCECGLGAYDKLHYYVGELPQVPECIYVTHYNPSAVTIEPYIPIDSDGSECAGFQITSASDTFHVSTTNYGYFTISGFTGPATAYGDTVADVANSPSNTVFRYSVSLNPADNNYILKVLGTDPHDGEAPLYVESLYDVAYIQGIEAKEIQELNQGLTFYDVCYPADLATVEPVVGLVTKPEGNLSRKDVGKRFLFARDYNTLDANDTTYHRYQLVEGKLSAMDPESETETGERVMPLAYTMRDGTIYTVRAYIDSTYKRHYFYTHIDKIDTTVSNSLVDTLITSVDWDSENVAIAPWAYSGNTYNLNLNNTVVVKNLKDDYYYTKEGQGQNGTTKRVTCDLNNYKSPYRFASTPWIVSNVKGDYNNLELNRLFRFHTISDGNDSNNQVKVSISNIMPDEGTFNVLVRDINDTDAYPIILESFSKVNLTAGDKNYLGYKIGTYDGTYESKSKYITVEINETLITKNSVPAGFLGYPLVHFNGTTPVSGAKVGLNAVAPYIKYNCNYDEDVKNRKQYFGLSDIVGVDIDMFTFKGNSAYLSEDDPDYPASLSNGFHLDSRVDLNSYGDDEHHVFNLLVDGQPGFKFDTTSVNNVTATLEGTPVIGTEEEMYGSIFEYANLRKFTVYFYGGFDGWDEYRDSRTIEDKYMYSKYRGQYNDKTGEGFAFSKINNPELLSLNQKGITSDWYAYLSAIRKFANPEEVDINVFATPGIDYVNNQKLVEETIEMIEEERADSIYVVTTPDKPKGAMDYVNEMYTSEEVVENLEYTEIDSNYTCTYYPWVKYEDIDNHQYIYLPATKDVVRNMAMTDNIAQPWFAPAGIERGNVNCVKAHFITKLADEDVLYDGRVNPIKTFATEGVKVWGQKNMQVRESQLNRIAVRRLLLRMRKLIAISCLGLIFEPNDATTKDKFLSTVTPIMDNIRANRGITDYKIEVDDSIEARERRELPAKIFFKPINALEYIPIDFILTPEGVSFDNI